jgi:hypothetical protein
MTHCPECARFRGESALAFSEYTARKDDLAMTRKTDKSFKTKRRAFEQAQGRHQECHKREQHHRIEAHSGYGSSAESSSVAEKFCCLRECLDIGDADGVQRAIFDLGPSHNGWAAVPDEVVERLLTLLRSDEMYSSRLAGHVLNYFEFEASSLSARQKSLCIGFLRAHGDNFTDVHSQQVVMELREGKYLAFPTADFSWVAG